MSQSPARDTTVAPVVAPRANPFKVAAAQLDEARNFSRSVKTGTKRERGLRQQSLAIQSNQVKQPTGTPVSAVTTPSQLTNVTNGSSLPVDFVPPHKRKTMEAEARRAAAAAAKTLVDRGSVLDTQQP